MHPPSSSLPASVLVALALASSGCSPGEEAVLVGAIDEPFEELEEEVIENSAAGVENASMLPEAPFVQVSGFNDAIGLGGGAGGSGSRRDPLERRRKARAQQQLPPARTLLSDPEELFEEAVALDAPLERDGILAERRAAIDPAALAELRAAYGRQGSGAAADSLLELVQLDGSADPLVVPRTEMQARIDNLRQLDELEDDDGGGPFGGYAEAATSQEVLLERSTLWLVEDPIFQEVEGERMAVAGLDPQSWLELLKQLDYLPADYDGDFDDPDARIARFRALESTVKQRRLDEALSQCRLRPGETLEAFYYRNWGTRPFQDASKDAASTFSADVDTGSYTLARRLLNDGYLPAREQIRVEEFVNYFDAGLPDPGLGILGDANFALDAELAPSPFGPASEMTWLLRVGAKARPVDNSQRSPLNLTFVVDNSGSMGKGDRLRIVQGALRMLVEQLDGRDSIALIGFAQEATTLLELTPANHKASILAAIDALVAQGGTNVESGIVSGFEAAAGSFDTQCVNRVVLLSDGVGNIGETDQERLLELVAKHQSKGIYLNTMGVGLSNYHDEFLEQLADRGQGLYNYFDSAVEARKAIVGNFTRAFEPVARDVKLQVTFDPERVGRYRLLGYENRAIADRDFTNAEVDAAELNSGHEVVALYELQDVRMNEQAPLGTFRLRYKPPYEDREQLGAEADLESELALELDSGLAQYTWRNASLGLQRSTLAAQAAEVLRRSGHARGDSLLTLVTEALRVAGEAEDPDFLEFAGILRRRQPQLEALITPPSEAQELLDRLKFANYELELERTADGTPDPELIAAKEAAIESIEAELRSLVGVLPTSLEASVQATED